MSKLDMYRDKIVRAFRTPKQRRDDEKKYNNFLEEQKQLNAYLKKRDSEYKKNYPSVKDDKIYDAYFSKELGLTHKPRKTSSDTELEELALKRVNDGYANDKKNILNKYSHDRTKMANDIENTAKRTSDDLVNIADRAKEAKMRATDKHVRNGIMKSSINDGVSKDIARGMYDDMDKVIERRDNIIRDREHAINKLKEDRNVALNNLDLKHARELDREKARLKREEEHLNDSIDRYNDDVDAKEARFQVYRAKAIEDLKAKDETARRNNVVAERMGDYWGEKKVEYDNRYNVAVDLYDQLPRDIAIEEIKKNRDLEAYLGKYYTRLLSRYMHEYL